MSLSSIAFAPLPKLKWHTVSICYTECQSNIRKYYQNLSSVSCERRIRTPVLQLMRLASYHCSTSLCVPHTRHVVSGLRLCGLRTFTANRIMFHCCTYFFPLLHSQTLKTSARCVHHVFSDNNTLLYCCYDIFNLYTVLIRIHTAERWPCFANRAERPTTKYGIMFAEFSR